MIIKKRYPYWMAAPGVLFFILFFIVPTLIGLFYSFQYWDMFSYRFAGFDNYVSIFTNPNVKVALPNTLIFAAVTTIGKVGIGFALALYINQKLITKQFLRVSFFLPAIISTIAVGIMFTSILHPTVGLLNQILDGIGLGNLKQGWLIDGDIAIYSISMIEIWKWAGFTMIIFLAGLQSISKTYYEAAKIDGANAFQRFFNVTLPLIMPAFNNAFVLSLIGGLKVFDIVQSTTQGGPGNQTMVLNTIIYKSFGKGYYGEASAANAILSILVGVFAITCYKLFQKREVEL